MMWGHAIGIYLLAGVVLNGLGHLVRARWGASGEMKPYNLAPGRRWIPWVVNFFAILLWPVLLVTFSIGFGKRRKEITMGGTSSFIVGRRPLISKAAEEYTKSVLAKMARHSQAPERGAPVSPGVEGVPPEESLYRCSACGLMSEGPAPASNEKGWPLCVKCKVSPS